MRGEMSVVRGLIELTGLDGCVQVVMGFVKRGKKKRSERESKQSKRGRFYEESSRR